MGISKVARKSSPKKSQTLHITLYKPWHENVTLYGFCTRCKNLLCFACGLHRPFVGSRANSHSVLPTGERRLGVHLTGPHAFINPHHDNVQFRTCIWTHVLSYPLPWVRPNGIGSLILHHALPSSAHPLSLPRADGFLSSRVTGFSSPTMEVLTLVTLMPKP